LIEPASARWQSNYEVLVVFHLYRPAHLRGDGAVREDRLDDQENLSKVDVIDCQETEKRLTKDRFQTSEQIECVFRSAWEKSSARPEKNHSGE